MNNNTKPELDIRGMALLKRKVAEQNQQHYADLSKQRLKKIAGTKIQTAFIGALAQFETFFGFLWGHGQDEPLSESQEQMKELWEKCRTEVLNTGNNQRRSLDHEIDLHYVRWERHQVVMPVKPLPKQGEANEQRSEQGNL